jgi:hypothetical protein
MVPPEKRPFQSPILGVLDPFSGTLLCLLSDAQNHAEFRYNETLGRVQEVQSFKSLVVPNFRMI